ncbi:unnamed protein product [Lepeophtheirus salmonis]|uniref:(salmon louse) hypothetical protein n=1 Tax=Lepeophtheirus salmonis TaxID=72036 RepID=A0A0K2T2C0_LEPSM|nr:unnamed protein product [Lepeophtheirus salmonis]CAF3006111.1 unnamed protein product [Lepeophtheirus salmonis]
MASSTHHISNSVVSIPGESYDDPGDEHIPWIDVLEKEAVPPSSQHPLLSSDNAGDIHSHMSVIQEEPTIRESVQHALYKTVRQFSGMDEEEPVLDGSKGDRYESQRTILLL